MQKIINRLSDHEQVSFRIELFFRIINSGFHLRRMKDALLYRIPAAWVRFAR
jgi:hypothetical protein